MLIDFLPNSQKVLISVKTNLLLHDEELGGRIKETIKNL